MSEEQIVDGTALVVSEKSYHMTTVEDIEQAAQVYDAIRRAATDRMIEAKDGHKGDYGIIPGTTEKTLLKPGAEKLCNFFGLSAEHQFEEYIKKDKYVYIRVRLTLRSKKNGEIVATGTGSINTDEKKYHKQLFPEKYPARKNKDGSEYRPEPVNLGDLLNTLEKMAKKRALVDATLTATGLSDIYTQDLEDMEPAVRGQNKPQEFNRDDEISFGKHKGTKWRDLPGGYLEWLKDQDYPSAVFAQKELDARQDGKEDKPGQVQDSETGKNLNGTPAHAKQIEHLDTLFRSHKGEILDWWKEFKAIFGPETNKLQKVISHSVYDKWQDVLQHGIAVGTLAEYFDKQLKELGLTK